MNNPNQLNNFVPERGLRSSEVIMVETVVATSVTEQQVLASSCEEVQEILSFLDLQKERYGLDVGADPLELLIKSAKWN